MIPIVGFPAAVYPPNPSDAGFGSVGLSANQGHDPASIYSALAPQKLALSHKVRNLARPLRPLRLQFVHWVCGARTNGPK